MNYLTRLYAYSNKAAMKTFIRTYTTNYSSCHASAYKCNYPEYMFSPIGAVITGGCIFSFSIKHHISNELLYIERQNDEIIERLKRIEKETQNNIEK
jgi:hypothetical protein